MSVEVVQKDVGYLLEGPHWDDVTNTLLYVDIYGQTIHRYDPTSSQADKVNIGETVGAVVTTRSGRTLAAAKHRIGFVDWKTGGVETIVEVEEDKPTTKFNDAKCDPMGRFWAGTMGMEDTSKGPGATDKKQGSLYCLYPDRTIINRVQNVDISNGLAWTADRKTMYYVDSLTFGVDAFDYNIETGDIANRRQAFAIPRCDGIPDGMCIDSEDMLWVALFNGAAVIRYNPKTGEKLQTIKLPTTNITSCCWGGANLDELYVTCAKHHLTKEQLEKEDTAGSLFRVTGLGVKGVKSEPFNDSELSQ
ncbi:regucalcin-like [Diadema setosum]|uniref:regucalcin-like n=1 Tax=Diadema setosum TaxID=31175 RepID=UPI003B3B596C